MLEGENWKCSYCGHAQVLHSDRLWDEWKRLPVSECIDGSLAYRLEAVVCANNDCKKLSLSLALAKAGDHGVGALLRRWSLLPSSFAKPQPDYIPEVIRNDYYEACAICDLSPKASATLTRRCLQGMIRHFCAISERTLAKELDELRARVDDGQAPHGVQHEHVVAIDHVRQIGNIGAHMEADINVIVDVDPNEAQTLIGLVELLFEEWYVAREKRKERLKRLAEIAAEKKLLKEQPPPQASDPSGAGAAG
jgi:Domain of unknown function (DUF4145)